MIVYKTTNLVNGKIYVGYDTKNCPDYFGSGKYYKRAEKKYGKENFRKATIDSDDDFKALCRKEIFWIDFLDARNPDIGYNFAEGGACWRGPHSEETKKKISIANKGLKRTEEVKRKMKESHCGCGMTGQWHSEETKEKISIANSGLKRTEETRQKMRDNHRGMLGKHNSEETKEKIRRKLKGRIPWNKGLRSGVKIK